jgi:hypothetical protein
MASAIRRYFFRPGGAYSIAICRMALFGCLFIHVYWGALANGIGDPTHYYQMVDLAAYYPKGLVWLLFPNFPPPASLIQILLFIGPAATLCALVGFLTRVTMIVSVLCMCFLGAFLYSWEPLWSHPYNGELLAGIGFMLGRAGDTLSVDSLIARYVLRRPIALDREVYWWPVILGMFGASAVYFGGFYAKWSSPNFTYDLAWVFSDNLRNSVSLPWLIFGRPLPPQVSLIVNHPWIWRLAAFGHLATQALPIFAVLSLTKPYVRLLEGLIFVAGTVLLKEVMAFWNPQWILLAAFFVDWDYFLGRLRLRLPSKEPARPVAHGRLIVAYAAAFMAANLVVILARLDEFGNRAYPFSSMTFYSNVAARKPYSEHLHYPFPYAELELEYPDDTRRKWSCYPNINSLYVMTFRDDNLTEKLTEQIGAIRGVVERVKSETESKVPDCVGLVDVRDYSAIDLYSSVLDIPPYPETVRFALGFHALVGRYERNSGRVIAAAGGVSSAGNNAVVDVVSQGMDVARYDILLANDPWKNYKTGPLLVPLGTWKGAIFTFDPNYYAKLPSSWYPIVIRVTENSGHSYDFFGGILYR